MEGYILDCEDSVGSYVLDWKGGEKEKGIEVGQLWREKREERKELRVESLDGLWSDFERHLSQDRRSMKQFYLVYEYSI